MSIRSYGAVITGVLMSIFSFDLLWGLTQIEAIGAMFTALLFGIFAACAFVFLTEPKPVKKTKPEYEFATDSTGLSVLIRRKAS